MLLTFTEPNSAKLCNAIVITGVDGACAYIIQEQPSNSIFHCFIWLKHRIKGTSIILEWCDNLIAFRNAINESEQPHVPSNFKGMLRGWPNKRIPRIIAAERGFNLCFVIWHALWAKYLFLILIYVFNFPLVHDGLQVWSIPVTTSQSAASRAHPVYSTPTFNFIIISYIL